MNSDWSSQQHRDSSTPEWIVKILFPILVRHGQALPLSADPIKPIVSFPCIPLAAGTFEPKAFVFKRSAACVCMTHRTSFVNRVAKSEV